MPARRLFGGTGEYRIIPHYYSYWPGRYDEIYEQKGVDYPYAYVRWTENRNMIEYLRLLAKGIVDVAAIIEGVFPIKDIEKAFETLSTSKRPLMVLLNYGKPPQKEDTEKYKPSTLAIKRPNAIDSNERILQNGNKKNIAFL